MLRHLRRSDTGMFLIHIHRGVTETCRSLNSLIDPQRFNEGRTTLDARQTKRYSFAFVAAFDRYSSARSAASMAIPMLA